MSHHQQQLCKDMDSTCPTCKAPGLHEKTSHVMRCHKRKTTRDQCLQAMKTTLAQIQTNNLVKATTQKGMMNWILQPYGNLQPPRQRHNDKLTKLLTEAVQEQNKIGWNNFMKGRTSREWGEVQQAHCSEKRTFPNEINDGDVQNV